MRLWRKSNLYEGETAYIVGKGPSLERLTKEHFKEDGPVFVINSAIEKVEKLGLSNPIYSVQKDRICSPVLPTTTLLLHRSESMRDLGYSRPNNVVIFRNLELGLKVTDFSALTCIRLAQQCGCEKFCFVCFDSITMNNFGVWKGANDEAYSERYIIQAMRMQPYLNEITHIWITP